MMKLEPCIGIHVRHGDTQHSKTKLDRSIDAHVRCARPLAEYLGIPSFYLASDDVEVSNILNFKNVF